MSASCLADCRNMNTAALPKFPNLDVVLDADALDRTAASVTPWIFAAALVLLAGGFFLGLSLGPWDQHQLAMLHIPAVWVATLLLLSAAFWAATGLVTEHDQLTVLVHAIVPTGGMFSFLAMWSGALWIKSLHGVWWLGSAREWAGVALFAVYISMLVLPALLSDRRRGDRVVSVFALLGVSQVMLTYFSAEWWNVGHGLHEGLRTVQAMEPAMVSVALGFWAYATGAACVRLRSILIERRRAPPRMEAWGE